MKIKMKNRSHRYDIIRPRAGHRHKYTKYQICLSIMMLICIKQHVAFKKQRVKLYSVLGLDK